jgi:hypothetical protein
MAILLRLRMVDSIINYKRLINFIMKSNNILWLLLFVLFSFCTACKKTKTEPDPIPAVDQLPPITQTGANTFGCLINGNVWIPKGFDGNFINSRINIDPTFMDGDLTIRVYRIEDGTKQLMTLASDSIKNIGTYNLGSNSRSYFIYRKLKSDLSAQFCEVFNSNISGNPYNIIGFIRITRYDLANKIFSGEFEITFNNATCVLGDPVKITNGRFDYRL